MIWWDSYIDLTKEVDFAAGADHFGELAECRDIGYLVHKNKRGKLVLAVSRCYADNTARIANTIPFKWVKEIIELEPKHDSKLERPALPEEKVHPGVQTDGNPR